MGFGVDGGDDVHIAVARGGDIAASGVAAADIYRKGLVQGDGGSGGGLGSGAGLEGHLNGVHHAQTLHHVLVLLQVVQHGHVALVDQNGVDFLVVEGVHQFGCLRIALGGEGDAVLGVQLFHRRLGVRLVGAEHAKGVLEQLVHAAGIISPHIHGHGQGLGLRVGDPVQSVQAHPGIDNTHGEHQTEHHRQHGARRALGGAAAEPQSKHHHYGHHHRRRNQGQQQGGEHVSEEERGHKADAENGKQQQGQQIDHGLQTGAGSFSFVPFCHVAHLLVVVMAHYSMPQGKWQRLQGVGVQNLQLRYNSLRSS